MASTDLYYVGQPVRIKPGVRLPSDIQPIAEEVFFVREASGTRIGHPDPLWNSLISKYLFGNGTLIPVEEQDIPEIPDDEIDRLIS